MPPPPDEEGGAGTGWALSSSLPGSPSTPKFFGACKPLSFPLGWKACISTVGVPSTVNTYKGKLLEAGLVPAETSVLRGS